MKRDLDTPVTLRYRKISKPSIVCTIKAVSITGSYRGCRSYYNFKLVDGSYLEIELTQLLPKYRASAQKLGGRESMKRLFSSHAVRISMWPGWEDNLSGLPTDTEQVWEINGGNDWWLIQCSGIEPDTPQRCILHVLNNPEEIYNGDLHSCLLQIFPEHEITLHWYERIYHREVIKP